MLQPVSYASQDTIPLIFEKAILKRAWDKHRDLQKIKSQKVDVLSWKDFSAG